MQLFIEFISKHIGLSIAFAGVLVSLIFVEWIRAKRKLIEVNPSQAIQLINHQNAVIFDFRTPEAFSKAHIINAISLSYQDILAEPKKIEPYRTRPIITLYATSPEAAKITAHLKKLGFNIHPLAGGLNAWIHAQMPLIKES